MALLSSVQHQATRYTDADSSATEHLRTQFEHHNTVILNTENIFENVVHQMTAIFFRLQCVTVVAQINEHQTDKVHCLCYLLYKFSR